MNKQAAEARLIPVGSHECVTCGRCACTFAAVHPACPRCSEEARAEVRLRVADALKREYEEALHGLLWLIEQSNDLYDDVSLKAVARVRTLLAASGGREA